MTPRFVVRWRAVRREKWFVDVVTGEQVWRWSTHTGASYMGVTRWGFWVRSKSV